MRRLFLVQFESIVNIASNTLTILAPFVTIPADVAANRVHYRPVKIIKPAVYEFTGRSENSTVCLLLLSCVYPRAALRFFRCQYTHVSHWVQHRRRRVVFPQPFFFPHCFPKIRCFFLSLLFITPGFRGAMTFSVMGFTPSCEKHPDPVP